MTRGFVFIEISDEVHILVEITGRLNDRADTSGLLAIINKSQGNGDGSFHGDHVKSFFPLPYLPAGPFRSNHHDKIFIFPEQIHHLVNHHIFPFPPGNRYPTQFH